MHRLIAIVALTATLTGCGPQGKECTAIGASVGVGLSVKAPLAARVARADLEVCWAGRCENPRVELRPESAAVDQGCQGDTCSAAVSPTGGKHGFGDVPGLPKSVVRAHLTLLGTDGKKLLDRTVETTPKGVFPNGPDCGEGGPQAKLVVDGTGNITS